MSALDTLLSGHPIPTWRPVARAVMLLLAGAFAWAYLAQLEEVAMASGEVVPQGKLKVIQHLEGGIIEEIFVQEGDTVQSGQALVQLDLASGGTNREELRVRLDGLLLVRAKLQAEAEDRPLEFPAEVAKRRSSQVLAQRQAFEARRCELDSTINVLQSQVRQREAQDELGQTEQSIDRISELLSQADKQDLRAEIKSPIDGVVKNMRHNTIGGVVRPGEPIMEIVPTGENLVVEAKLSPTDRGYVAEGQPARVKISTYDFVRYGSLDGKVIRVAPDSTTDQSGVPYFRVIIETDKTFLGEEEGKLPIVPGMQAIVDIRTGNKSVLEYLVKPVLKLRHEAFRER